MARVTSRTKLTELKARVAPSKHGKDVLLARSERPQSLRVEGRVPKSPPSRREHRRTAR